MSKSRTDNLDRQYTTWGSKGIEGLKQLELDIHFASEMPDDVKTKFVLAGTELLAEASKKSAIAKDVYDEESNVHIADKIYATKPSIKKKLKGYVKVKGSRKRGENKTKTTNTEIAFMNEYGSTKRGIKKKMWMWDAWNKNKQKAVDAAATVFYDWLKQNNL